MHDTGERPATTPTTTGRPTTGVPIERPRARSLDSVDEGELIGRDVDLARARALVAPGRVLTIFGPGGVGKTRLALALAVEIERDRDTFRDGVFMCELASVVDGDAVPLAIADATGLVQHEDASSYDALVSGLRGRSAVVVLDNCEQIVSAVGRLVVQLFGECPDLAVVITSRERLDLDIEDLLELGPLDVETAARELFVQRAVAAEPTFAAESNRHAVAAICRSLDGLPLALELAAARLSTMSANELSERLDERFRVLQDGGRVGRHETLYATVGWSYDLLEPAERELFDRLSVFQGGFERQGAITLADPRLAPETVDEQLASLAARSMVQVKDVADPIDGRSARFELLETLRQFGDRQLSRRGERSTARNIHLDHTVDVVSTSNALAVGSQWVGAVRRLTRDWDNIRAAVNWAIDTIRVDDVDRLLRDLFFTSRWRLEVEPASWAERAISRAVATGTEPGAPAHLHVAFQHFLAGDHEAALRANVDGLHVAGTPSDRSWCRNYAAIELLYLGRTAEAAAMADEMVREPPPRLVEQAMQLGSHAVFKMYARQFTADEALAQIDRADEMARSTESSVAIGLTAYNRALCEYGQGDVVGYRNAMDTALAHARADGIANLTGYVLTAQVYAPGRSGLRVAQDALGYWASQRDLSNEFVVLEATGINLVELRRFEDGAVILGNLENDRRRMASSAARRESAMGEIRLQKRSGEWVARGARMTRGELLEYADGAIARALDDL